MAGIQKMSLIGLVAACLVSWASMSADAAPPRSMPWGYPRPVVAHVPRTVPLGVYRPMPAYFFPGYFTPPVAPIVLPREAALSQYPLWTPADSSLDWTNPVSDTEEPAPSPPPRRVAPGGRSVITLVNHSGKPVLARLVGPTRSEVALDEGQGGSIRHVRPGTYAFVVRLGAEGGDLYGRTEDFEVPDLARMTVTIGAIEQGEAVRHSSKAEFDAAQ